MNSILIASPIRKPVAIVKCFLESLKTLESGENIVNYCFVDDNDDIESSELIRKFTNENETSKILDIEDKIQNTSCENEEHFWTISKIDKIVYIKNKIVEYFLTTKHSHIFFIDADLVLHPKTLVALIESEKDIVSNIFWTKWNENSQPLPQVWLKDFYTLYDDHMLTPRSSEEIQFETFKFLSKLQLPGVYKVGGLGACTLIKRGVFEKGVNYSPLYNISFWGEDRSFCIRAVAMGFELYVNTFYPSYHIFRLEELDYIQNYINMSNNNIVKEEIKNLTKNNDFERIVREIPKITLSIIVKNEEKRYLRRVLESAKKYIHEAVIIDDGSTDNTIDLCMEVLEGIKIKVVKNKESKFNSEWKLRKQQWDETIATDPDWIIFLDADEVFEENFNQQVKELVKNKECDVYVFRLYDFWDENHYREDNLWFAHTIYRPFMIRYQKNFNYEFIEKNQHCGRVPNNIFSLTHIISNARLKHFGWAKEEDRIEKYNRYMELDSEGQYGSLLQYQSILDTDVNLVEWIES